jgi:hypothetical protein
LKKKNNKVARLWQKDASLWSNADEGKWLGWLTITDEQLANLNTLKQFAQKGKEVQTYCCWAWEAEPVPEVLRMTFGKIAGFLNCTCWTRPIRRKSKLSRRSWTSKNSLHRVQQIRQHA